MPVPAPAVFAPALLAIPLLGIPLLGACGGPPPEAGGDRPANVVLIVVDDLGWGDLGSYGGALETPHLDALAAGGVRCTQAYAASSLCSPARAALLTGRYPQRFGHEHNTGDLARQRAQGIGLPLGERTLADHLAAAGYATAAVGKWHLGAGEDFHPLRRGFGSFFGFLGGGHGYLAWDDEEGGPLLRDGAPAEGEGYLTDAFTDASLEFVRANAARPFFLYLAYNAPHAPLEPPPGSAARFAAIADPERRAYAAMVASVDDGVGRLTALLAELDLARDTLVVLLSDNGPPADGPAHNGPWRGDKGSLFEGGVRVPLLLRWPARLPAGTTYDGLLSALDVVPTALAAADAGPGGPALDGVDLAPHLRGEAPGAPHAVLFWRRDELAGARLGEWKWIHTRRGRDRLYHLSDDPGEQRDLAAAEPARAAELGNAWEAWAAELVDPLWTWTD